MKKLTLLLLISLGSLSTFSQSHTLSGYVRDATNGEELIGVTVYVKELANGVVTNAYGFYSITLDAGDYNVQYSYLGFENSLESISLNENRSVNIDLKASVSELEEVVINGDPLDANVTNVKMSVNELDIKQVKKLPALFGEPDIIKTIQMLPGVLNAGEGTSAFFVRGGSADQNLILIDEAPVYDPSHLFGLFSVFNADVIKESELYKGGIPSQYGGRLSSILDVRTKDGNNKKLSGSAGLGLLASRLMIEGPIKKEKSSFIVSARRSYVDLFLKAAGEKSLVYFYDVNAKANWRVDNKNRFFLALYTGRDDFSFDDTFGFDWGNRTATFRWNHLFNDRLFSNTSLIASTFDYGLELKDAAQGFLWTSSLQEYSLKQDMSYFINPQNELSFGYHGTVRKFSPGQIDPHEGSINIGLELNDEYALDHAFYIGNEQKVSDRISLQYGARLSIFQSMGKNDIYTYEDRTNNVQINRLDTLHFDQWENIKTYVNLEPRFSMRYMVDQSSSIKASYNRMVQNTHLISSGTVPVPFNTWAPSGYHLDPQIADQVALGYFKNLKDNNYEFSTEAYYKEMTNVTDFADNAQIFFNRDLATEYRQGKSDSYGLEFMVKKKEGKLTGFASYTWSKTQRTVPDVNQGNTFLANYDRRNSFNAVATYEYNDKWTFGANFTYSTGRPMTAPSANYQFGDEWLADYYTERNGLTLPDFHRMDLSATLTPRKNKDRNWESSWNFSLYNAYSRKNVFSVYSRQLEDEDGQVIDPNLKETRKISLFPVLPSVTYNIKF